MKLWISSLLLATTRLSVPRMTEPQATRKVRCVPRNRTDLPAAWARAVPCVAPARGNHAIPRPRDARDRAPPAGGAGHLSRPPQEFGLDEDLLEDLPAELILARGVAADAGGRVLVEDGCDARPSGALPPSSAQHTSRVTCKPCSGRMRRMPADLPVTPGSYGSVG
jgi:hypothetical protein